MLSLFKFICMSAVACGTIGNSQSFMVASPKNPSDPVKVNNNAQEPKKPLLFEGDIAGIIEKGDTAEDLKAKLTGWNKAGVSARQRWPNGLIPYAISSQFSGPEQSQIVRAMREIETKTGAVRFVQRTTHKDYVNIFRGNGCYSRIGKASGAQELSLGNGCVRHGTIMHELLHAIGFYHEQARIDRDSYVDINWGNIQPGMQDQYNKYNSETFGTAYDFGSIMHYPTVMFATNPSVWTIRPKPQYSSKKIGQMTALSPIDIQEVKAMYGITTSTVVDPVENRTCAMLFHERNFVGKKIRVTSGHNGNLDAADQGQVKSAIISAGCKLATYSSMGCQGEKMDYPTLGSREGFFNFVRSVNCVQCRCT